MESDKNGFPKELNFEGKVNKFIGRNGILMYPFFTSRYYNNDRMMKKFNLCYQMVKILIIYIIMVLVGILHYL